MNTEAIPAQGPVDVVVGRLRAMAAKSDAVLSKRAGYETTDISTALHSLLKHGRIEVGYRQSCGKTDPTAYMYREWVKLLKAAEKGGLQIAVEPVKHGNSWATKSGGFWSSAIYTLPETPNYLSNAGQTMLNGAESERDAAWREIEKLSNLTSGPSGGGA